MIGSIKDLEAASRGKMSSRSVPAKEQPPQPAAESVNPYSEALRRRTAFSQSPMSPALYGTPQAGELVQSVLSAPRTQTFMSAVGGGRPTGGLSSKGKYGGFYSASDLQAAIEGSAIGMRETMPSQLREYANQRYSKMEQMLGKAYAPTVDAGTAAFNPNVPSAGNIRIFESMKPEQQTAMISKSGSYLPALNKWYKEQAAPAEEYLSTAQQIESTPLSSLASAIAVQQYGMNPALAAGKFTNLDSSYYQSQRDKMSLAQYGVPYQQYQDQLKAQQALTKQTSAEAKASLENLTGYSTTSLARITNQTPDQMAAAVKRNDYVFKNPETNDDVAASGEQIVQIVKDYASVGNTDMAEQIINDVGSRQGADSLYNILVAIMKNTFYTPEKAKFDYGAYMR